METTKIRDTLLGLQAAAKQMDRGLSMVLERRSGPEQSDLVELCHGIREMHRSCSALLTQYGGGAHPLIDLSRRSAKALEVMGRTAADFSLDRTIDYILQGFVDGIARPGCWERDVARRFFKLEAVLEAHRAITGS